MKSVAQVAQLRAAFECITWLSMVKSTVSMVKCPVFDKAWWNRRFKPVLIKHGEISCQYGEMTLTVSMVKF